MTSGHCLCLASPYPYKFYKQRGVLSSSLLNSKGELAENGPNWSKVGNQSISSPCVLLLYWVPITTKKNFTTQLPLKILQNTSNSKSTIKSISKLLSRKHIKRFTIDNKTNQIMLSDKRHRLVPILKSARLSHLAQKQIFQQSLALFSINI